MALSVINNVSLLYTRNNLNRTSLALNSSLEHFSSGLKINHGADGPASLVISQEQRAQITGLNTAISNTSKAVNLVQTGEGALNEINSLLTQVRGLAVDSANSGVNDANALAANQAQITNALSTIDIIAKSTQFGTKKLLDGSADSSITADKAQTSPLAQDENLTINSVKIELKTGFTQQDVVSAINKSTKDTQVTASLLDGKTSLQLAGGATSPITVKAEIEASEQSSGFGAIERTSSGASLVFQIGANASQTATLSIGSVQTNALGSGADGNITSLDKIDVTTAKGPENAIKVIDKAISDVSNVRGRLGAFQTNTLEATANNLQATLDNTTAAESTIRNTDFAAETANFTKNQVLLQAGTQVLLQNANQTSQLALSLLRG